ncbi:MAG TPA: glycosyltransferase family 39 protein, partial [Anaerolineales bacterium]
AFEPEALPASRPAQPASQPLAAFPWRTILSFVLALTAQRTLEPPGRQAQTGVILYILSFAVMVWAALRSEWAPAALPADERCPEPLNFRRKTLLIGVVLSVLAYLALGGGLFNDLNVFLWLLAMAFVTAAFWLPGPAGRSWLKRLLDSRYRPRWSFSISPWTLLILAAFALAIFFRAYQLNQVPAEMNSDHAEKLLDVTDVLSGITRIFFPRNTGREALQFYLTAAVSQVFGTGISFLSLKIGTLLGGLLTLPFIYLLGKEAGNRRIGLIAMAFAGIAYWPNVITRIALRFTFYPLFVAPALYFLVRGLRRNNRNDFILSGIALGIGLHGYTPIRILPLVIAAAVGIYLLHRQSQGVRRDTLLHLIVLAVVALVIFLPLLRYAQDNPHLFAFRAFTRLTDWERPLPGPAWQIFLQNTWNAMTMFGWDNGEVWTTSIPHRPALDVISAALFYLGMGVILVRYIRRRHWLDLFLLVSIPMLMLPSILSLAFPAENPQLSRTGGAFVVAFVILAIALDGLLQAVRRSLSEPGGTRLALAFGLLLFTGSAFQNYDLVFEQYNHEYQASAWNTSEMGQVIRDFAVSIGAIDNAWVVGFPYWVDTRLVGMVAGYPTRDTVILPDQLSTTETSPGAKLFLVKPEDQKDLDALHQLYPKGWSTLYKSKMPGKDFLMYFVPPANNSQ